MQKGRGALLVTHIVFSDVVVQNRNQMTKDIGGFLVFWFSAFWFCKDGNVLVYSNKKGLLT
jgi:hypothetical protein